MDDLENSPLLRVFKRNEKPPTSSRNISTSRLSRKKSKDAGIQKPLRVLQPSTVAEHIGSEIRSCYGSVYENGLRIRCSVKNQETFTPEPNSSSACTDSSDLWNSGKANSCSQKTESVDNVHGLSKKNEVMINLISDDENNNPFSDPSSDAVNILTEQSDVNHHALSSLESEEFTELSPQSQKSTTKESADVKHVQQNDYDIVTDSHTSEDHISHSVVYQTIKITSDKSSDGNIDDVWKYPEKLEVSNDPAPKNSMCEILCTPEKSQPKSHVPNTTKKLEVLQSFFSSDEDYSPPPLSKRLWTNKQTDVPSAEHTEKDLAPKKTTAKHIGKDTVSSVPRYINKDAPPSSPVHHKKKGASAWKNIREEESEVSSSDESGDGSDSDEETGSSGSEDFEQFLVHLKTPVKTEIRNPRNQGVGTSRNFIGTGKIEKKKNTNAACSPLLPKVKAGSKVLSNQPGDICQNYLDTKGKEKTASYSSDDSNDSTSPSESSESKVKKASSKKASFLASLSADVPDSLADSTALMYRKQFMKKKEELVEKLFTLYNCKVFNNKLPKDMKVIWNPNLTKTAGKCFSKRDHSLGRVSWIELAPKILDSADRVRDTLVHEMCHAACWLIHGNRGGHGSLWKFWASRVQQMFPDIPPVTTCHSYKINTKYVYVCTGCGGRIGRHSKSIDITKSVCSRCKSKFELVVNGKTNTKTRTSSKPTTGFALFVKENYGNLKQQHAGVKHGDIMKMLSAEFSLKTKITA